MLAHRALRVASGGQSVPLGKVCLAMLRKKKIGDKKSHLITLPYRPFGRLFRALSARYKQEAVTLDKNEEAEVLQHFAQKSTRDPCRLAPAVPVSDNQ